MALFYAVAGALALATTLVLVRPLIRPLAGRAGVETPVMPRSIATS